MNAEQFQRLIDFADAENEGVWVVNTQVLENYGAHCDDGLYTSGNAYWKFKAGEIYIVTDIERRQDALAFVAALCMENTLGYKEFPTGDVDIANAWWCETQERAKVMGEYADEFLTAQIESLKWVSPESTKLRRAA